jgi:DNA-binding FadR family transcriptional regulator
LADEVVEQIKRMIVDEEVKRGEKLPSEKSVYGYFYPGNFSISY